MKNPAYIFVCQQGFVLVARPRPQRPGDDYMMFACDDVAVVRRWGTTRGLGQLATEGPQPETALDPEPDGTEICRADVKRKIPCTKAWDEWTSQTR